MQIEFRRVTLVTGGLLEINPVRQDMAMELVQKDPHTELAASRVQFREINPGIKQAERLTGKMSVRRKIVGQIFLNVRGMRPDPGQYFDEQLVRQRPRS